MCRAAPLLLAALAACASGEDPAVDGMAAKKRGPPPPAPTAAIGFSTARVDGPFASATHFPIAATPQIEIAVDWTGVSGSQSQRLDVVAPNGQLYASAVVAFATTTQAAGSEVQATLQPDGSYRVWSTLQVSGTPIEMYQLVGTWTVSATLTGGPTFAATFTLY